MNKQLSQMPYVLTLCLLSICTGMPAQTLAQLTQAVENIKNTTPDGHEPRCKTLQLVYAAKLGAIKTELSKPEDRQEDRRIADGFTNENGLALTKGELQEQQAFLEEWIANLVIEWDLAAFFGELDTGRAAIYLALLDA